MKYYSTEELRRPRTAEGFGCGAKPSFIGGAPPCFRHREARNSSTPLLIDVAWTIRPFLPKPKNLIVTARFRSANLEGASCGVRPSFFPGASRCCRHGSRAVLTIGVGLDKEQGFLRWQRPRCFQTGNGALARSRCRSDLASTRNVVLSQTEESRRLGPRYRPAQHGPSNLVRPRTLPAPGPRNGLESIVSI